MAKTTTKRTLVLEIAVPDYFLDDWDETVAFYEEHEMGDTDTLDIIWNESGVCSGRVNLSILLGDKGGMSVERIKGQMVGAKVLPRQPEHELPDDSRLDDLEERS